MDEKPRALMGHPIFYLTQEQMDDYVLPPAEVLFNRFDKYVVTKPRARKSLLPKKRFRKRVD